MDHLAVIGAESERFASVLATAAADATCPTCPDWTARDLLWHLTEVHLFWAAVLATGATTDDDIGRIEAAKPERPSDLAGLLALREEATAKLLDELARLDDADPRWSWWPADQTVGFTRRMQTYEATMHRIDAELTAGGPVGPMLPGVPAGAVDHCVDVMWGWMPDWPTYEPLTIARFDATDTGQSWTVEVGHWFGTGPESGREFDEPRAVRGTGDPSVSVTGPVEQLARWAWSRRGTVDVAGEPDAVAALERLISQGIQ